ncbi:MAG: nitroreductase family protein [Oscillospiraceae bacterium]|jgi:nitroreductase|nr:nitroreductase family protein [Oscillospiraceae bacterium]
MDDKTRQQLRIASCSGEHVDTLEDVIRLRHSTRNFQKNQIIPREIIDKLIDAARMAPSPKNSQPWFFYKVDDKQKMEEVAETLRKKSEEPMIRRTASAISSASAIIFVCKNTNSRNSFPSPSEQSIGAAIENLVLQATALGIDSLWVCDVLDAHDEIKRTLDLKYDFISAILLGFSPGADRKSIEEISSWL